MVQSGKETARVVKPLAHQCGGDVEHPAVIRPSAVAPWRSDKMGKWTIFESPRLLVGLNAFEPGQSHALHAHAGMDKLYQVVDGEGVFLLEPGRPAGGAGRSAPRRPSQLRPAAAAGRPGSGAGAGAVGAVR